MLTFSALGGLRPLIRICPTAKRWQAALLTSARSRRAVTHQGAGVGVSRELWWAAQQAVRPLAIERRKPQAWAALAGPAKSVRETERNWQRKFDEFFFAPLRNISCWFLHTIRFRSLTGPRCSMICDIFLCTPTCSRIIPDRNSSLGALLASRMAAEPLHSRTFFHSALGDMILSFVKFSRVFPTWHKFNNFLNLQKFTNSWNIENFRDFLKIDKSQVSG